MLNPISKTFVATLALNSYARAENSYTGSISISTKALTLPNTTPAPRVNNYQDLKRLQSVKVFDYCENANLITDAAKTNCSFLKRWASDARSRNMSLANIFGTFCTSTYRANKKDVIKGCAEDITAAASRECVEKFGHYMMGLTDALVCGIQELDPNLRAANACIEPPPLSCEEYRQSAANFKAEGSSAAQFLGEGICVDVQTKAPGEDLPIMGCSDQVTTTQDPECAKKMGTYTVGRYDVFYCDEGQPLPSPVPTTLAPTTASPTTASPTTASPTTASPTTASPTTASPTTASPTTASPTTASPTTASPTTASPTTASPTTASPTTASPTTASPTTDAPTMAPTSAPTSAPSVRLF